MNAKIKAKVPVTIAGETVYVEREYEIDIPLNKSVYGSSLITAEELKKYMNNQCELDELKLKHKKMREENSRKLAELKKEVESLPETFPLFGDEDEGTEENG